MDAVHDKMAGDRVLVVWNPVSLPVEHEPVKGMFKESPENKSTNPRQNALVECALCECQEPEGDWKGDDRCHPVWALGDPLHEWVVK